ncbi:hypothetical protein [Lentilactobacillus buchneri]|uniref:hypothetical protein n=1 Tax=Lentilactobacillus buchneri TaxID=1581 RepID=UPI00129283B1|nr:hypothetical protein [Lentilactobacillus buchneri]MQN23439.1 hypothetical protein [Lentilactobacillus buchneri]
MGSFLYEYLKSHAEVTLHFVDGSKLVVTSADPKPVANNVIQFRTSDNEDVMVNIDKIIYVE